MRDILDNRALSQELRDELLNTASERGHTEMVQLLLQYGAKPTDDYRGRFALYYAVLAKEFETATVLIKHGASKRLGFIAMQDSDDWSEFEQKRMLKILERTQPNPDLVNTLGQSIKPFHLV